VTIVRPATIYGPRGKAFTADVADHLRRGTMAVIDGGRTRGGFCYVDNAVDGILRAAASAKTVGRAYNLADATGETWRSYVDALARGLGRRPPWIDISSGAAFSLAATLEAAHRAFRLPGRPLLTRHAVYLLSRDQEYPVSRARKDFGHAPSVSFEEGIDRTLEWLRA
jgi:nucleoside-diphosphate-sugar epimerase